MTPLSAPMSRLTFPAGSSSSSRMRRNFACFSTDFRNSATPQSVSVRVMATDHSCSGSDGRNGQRQAKMPPHKDEGDDRTQEPPRAYTVDDAGEPPVGAHIGPDHRHPDGDPPREVDQRKLLGLGE